MQKTIDRELCLEDVCIYRQRNKFNDCTMNEFERPVPENRDRV